MLDRLVLDAKELRVITGEFIAQAIEWRSSLTNAKERCLLKAFALLDIILTNVSQFNNYRKRKSVW